MTGQVGIPGIATVSDTIDPTGLHLLQEREALELHARRILGIEDPQRTERVYVTVGRASRTTTVHLTWWFGARRIDVWQKIPNRLVNERVLRALTLTTLVAELCKLAQVSRAGTDVNIQPERHPS